MNYLTSFIFFIIILLSKTVISDDNKIIFQIKDKIYTSIDLKNRVKYLQNFNSIDIETIEGNQIIDDFFSSAVFYEYVLNDNILYQILEKESNKILDKILINNTEINNILSEEIIKKNINYDFARKIVIENILDNYKEYIFSNTRDINYIYNYSINYITLSLDNIKHTEELDKVLSELSFDQITNYISENKINYYSKEVQIYDLNKVDKKMKELLKNNNSFFIEKNNFFLRIIKINKKLNIDDGVYYRLFNFETEERLEKNKQNCSFINTLDEINIREYEYNKLNENIKNNLLSINDFIIFQNNNLYNYIFLCEIRVNEKYLKELNINKKINFIAKDIEIDFLQKYAKLFNTKKYYE